MRGTTVKRIRLYANWLKADQAEKYKNLTGRKIYQRLKKIWGKDKDFQKFIRLATTETKTLD